MEAQIKNCSARTNAGNAFLNKLGRIGAAFLKLPEAPGKKALDFSAGIVHNEEYKIRRDKGRCCKTHMQTGGKRMGSGGREEERRLNPVE